MPAYNGARYIKEALESLISQSFADWELLVSDDASKDETEGIVREIASRDIRIRYVRQEKNLGMDANFQYLLDQADAPYFMWAAQDDKWEKDFLKACVAILDEKKEVGVAFTGMINLDSYGRLIREYPHFPEFSGKAGPKTVIKHLMSPEIMGKGNLMYGLMRTGLARKISSYYESKIAWGADVIFAFGLVVHQGAWIDPRVLFSKRHGGYSNPDSTKDDDPKEAKMLVFKNPKNHMFPIRKYKEMLRGYLDVSRGTGYGPLIRLLVTYRSLRAIMLYLRARNYRKFFTPRT